MDVAQFLKRPVYCETDKPPEFGHDMLRCFSFDPEYCNMNHGSYGSLPKPVGKACQELWAMAEAKPDVFHRLTYEPLLVAVREQLAAFLGVADPNEVVMVPNASHGINTVLRNFFWNPEDIIITCNTTYNSISRTAQYLTDIPPHPSSSQFTLFFPTTRDDILERWKAHLQSLTSSLKSGGKIIAVIDAIISNPGVLLPWKEMVKMCKDVGILSVIDAAHSIGQEQNINLDIAQPDFWVSNCHKWLLSKRPCAVLYVPKRNQHLVVSSFPTSHAYVSPTDRNGIPNFVNQYVWNGTIDFVPFLSVTAALHFREWIGGEKAIDNYCHSLAMQGGRKLASIMGTFVMDEDGVFTRHMVNVALPFPPGFPATVEVDTKIKLKLLIERKIYAAQYYHNGRWWFRCSAQIWNDMSDFERLGNIMVEVCKEVVNELASAKL